MEIKTELIGSVITYKHITIILEQSKECVSLCKKLGLKVFKENVKPTKKSK